ncbi:procathepsin L [Patella vulgata]|uniref:procathepsin L n=1 Tax=Patella vulgata TaxID=6465 RepID=UPI00217F4C49|nr:procathepsin L [Patella vulgata]
MLKLAILLVGVAIVAAINEDLNGEWEIFTQTYSKEYASEADSQKRRLIWEDNINFIQLHNLRADRGLHSYRLGMNAFGDMTRVEIVQKMNGYRMANRTRGATFMAPSHVEVLPTTVDWRSQGYVTPIKDQKECGSCWAFSSTGSLEGQHFKRTGKLVSLSEQNLMDCSKPEGNHGCGGGLMDFAFEYIKSNGGIDTEASYPYTARDGRCRYQAANVGATDVGFTDIPRDSESGLQQAVATVGPISVAIDASRSTFHFYKTGVYSDVECSSVRLDHGVLAVGYGTDAGSDYWLVKNSWGTVWGMQGYIMMSRNKSNQCGIATQASYPMV